MGLLPSSVTATAVDTAFSRALAPFTNVNLLGGGSVGASINGTAQVPFDLATATTAGDTSGSVAAVVQAHDTLTLPTAGAYGSSVFTISSGAGVLVANIQPQSGPIVDISVTWATSDVVTGGLLAAAINASIVNTLVAAVDNGDGTVTVTAKTAGTNANGILTVATGTGFTVNNAHLTGGNNTNAVIGGHTVDITWQGSALATYNYLLANLAGSVAGTLVTASSVAGHLTSVIAAIASGYDGNGITTTISGTAHGATFGAGSLSAGVGRNFVGVAGRFLISAGNQYYFTTNPYIGANSIVVPVLETVDATFISVVPVVSAGQVYFQGPATATGAVTVSFVVVNPNVI